MAQYLKGLGYTTGAVGKWHVGFQEGVNMPLDKGFDEYYGVLGGGRSYFYATDNTIDPLQAMRRGNAIVETASKSSRQPGRIRSGPRPIHHRCLRR